MLSLRLQDITKTYKSAETVVALKGINLSFRESEFVSVLGPSGCGKTTLLNIIGGLDKYDSGDLVIGGTSTREFKDSDWDAYRNHSIGFVFQSYNLISHQTVLQNVEVSLTLSGVSAQERKQRAQRALAEVGLADQAKKKPSQLSGGQMQRVAIARALVNNPAIILADEPTGALDSQASVQLMEILKEISTTRLVIMVTHNAELAKEYSSRIITMLDGVVQADDNPPQETETLVNAEADPAAREVASKTNRHTAFKKTSMSFITATVLSLKNLLTKKGRTLTTSFAGSIGIIGVALVLALSTGLSGFMAQMQTESLSGLPITISETPQTIERGPYDVDNPLLSGTDETGKFIEDAIVYSYDSKANSFEHVNVLTQEYFDYLANIQTALPGAVNTVSYARAVEFNVLARGEDTVVKFATVVSSEPDAMAAAFGGGSLYWQEMDNDEDLILSLYDLIGDGSRLPSEKNEIALVVDEYNRIDQAFFDKLGMSSGAESYQLTSFIGKTIAQVIPNNSYYTRTDDGLFTPTAVLDYDSLYANGEGLELTITGVLRIKENSASMISYLSPGLVYTTALTDYIVDDAKHSEIARAQANANKDLILNTPFRDDTEKSQRLLALGADATPVGISIYPKDYQGKDQIMDYLDAYNIDKPAAEQIVYSDIAQMVESMLGTMLNTVTYVLIGFAAISLLVSTIMIAIITYVSVLERTKEIGILRSVGARKRDISRVFNAEAVIIGCVAGLIGVGISYLLAIPINLVIDSLVGVNNVASLPTAYAGLLVLGSMTLTLIAGFIPSKMAAKKNPVEALRTE